MTSTRHERRRTSGREAIGLEAATDEMLALIANRRTALRTIVLAVGLTVFLAILSLPLRPSVALAGPPCLLWLWTSYILVDTWLVFRWRAKLIGSWRTGEINLGIFAGASETLPTLPQNTIQTLLHTLPVLPPTRDRDLGDGERAAIAAFSDWRWSEQTAHSLLPSFLVGIPSACATILLITQLPPHGIVLGMVAGLIGLAVVLRFGLPARRRRRLARALASAPANLGTAVMDTLL
jgi:hypothetical protein